MPVAKEWIAGQLDFSPRPAAEAGTRLDRLRRLVRLLDEAYTIPGTNYRIGWDALIGLIPAAGDITTALIALYVVRESARLGASKPIRARMTLNVAADLLAGSIPLIGDLADVAFKANRKNLELLERHLARKAAK